MQAAPGRVASPRLPLAYLIAAAAAFVLAALAVPWLAPELAGHYYQPRLLALTHTVTLGWITLTIMGASYQIVPIVLGRPIWSERLARWQLALTAAGIAGMVAHFFIGQWSGLLWAAGLVTLGVSAHLVNTALTVRGLTQWTFTARLVVLAHAGLGLTTLYGTLLGLDKVARVLPGSLFPNLHAHVHLALLGWVLPMVIGVAARVYPMFLLAREPAGWSGWVQFWGLGLGVPATVAGILASRALLAAGALAVTAAVIAHLAWVVEMVRGRRRPSLDWGLRFVLAGTLALVPATGLGLALAFDALAGPRVALSYATLALGAWASLTIVGMMLKIVPFLVWYRAYGPRAGREPVPTLPDLGWPAGERLAWVLLTTGFAALAAALWLGDATWIRAAGAVVAAGAAAFAVTLMRVLHHLTPCARRAALPAAPRTRTV
jgi:Cytochrome C and Quinol oxidase polypeptide I